MKDSGKLTVALVDANILVLIVVIAVHVGTVQKSTSTPKDSCYT